jgi:hypothetical protein
MGKAIPRLEDDGCLANVDDLRSDCRDMKVLVVLDYTFDHAVANGCCNHDNQD